ncbi:FHA domain-containing protein [Massilia sp. R2A-15]|uniref:FHA domain-containing protein n=1 Tax=Massilia sp. R2A-15 TaxID=3064278 RepID=UPI002734D389|nr:FHA domain-containing protein [Massilia sp. R2A-15]WLI88822.1 FHA domain-containing protein [Massilia sp. R2A-15]
MRPANEPDGGHAVAEARAPAGQQRMIVLQPLNPPGLADIRIDGSLFAVGRTEAPFASYPADVVADLSRRHARIFCEGGAVYLADLDSKNGTTVNGAALKQTITRLGNGDEIGFGRALSYRLKLVEGGPAPPPTATLASLTLTPESPDSGLQPIVVTEFPFLISKADDTFARYQASAPAQVNYLSRRHAHIFLKHGRPFIEDLGSTNGTFVDGTRLEEHAVALTEGSTVGFGGHHFVYRLSAQWDDPTVDPTVTRFGAAAAAPAIDTDKTTFVAAADSFLDIFCVDPPHEEPRAEAAEVPAAEAARARPQGRTAAFIAELRAAIGGEDVSKKPAIRLGLMALAALVVVTLALYLAGAPERDAQDLLASGNYAKAAAVATDGLARDPDNLTLRNLATQAQLKANVPRWSALLKARQFTAATSVVATMRQNARQNPELMPLVDELAWIGDIEKFVAARGGAEAASSSPADAARIKQILKQWEDETELHQRAFSTISSYVPEFRDTYAVALSHVRKLALSGGGPAHEQQSP